MDFWATSLDGWLGALIGAVAAVAIAVWVLRRTLAHERRLFLEQLEAERELGLEQRRLEAFGQVAAWTRRLVPTPVDRERMLVVQVGLVGAVQAWRTYLPSSDDPIGDEVEALSFSWLNRAWRCQREQARRNATLPPEMTKGMVVDEDMGQQVIGVMREVRRWHQGDVVRESLVAALRAELAVSREAYKLLPE
ncbi:hypothetical protein [Cellulomonas sp. C5510]|uniref:hypothetical protein n=1 Tax=Cellulomonas sp. C5510 TaxID=2871170 RepID=UPI001C9580C4|nr:hypothetical protein [Cellulomonas sp. C5510]QZN86926.1 hypothetical protein K5O09_07390 [Cellulomonas sp. C5510]